MCVPPYLKPWIMIPDDSEVDRPFCQAFCIQVHICTVPALIVTGEQCSNSRFMLYNSNQAGFIVRLWENDASMGGRKVWAGWKIRNFKSVHWYSTAGMWGTYKCQICCADCTVLYLNVNRSSQFPLHNLKTVDCTHKLTAFWKLKLTRQADIDQNLNIFLNSTCRYIKFESAAFPGKGLTTVHCNFHFFDHFQIRFCIQGSWYWVLVNCVVRLYYVKWRCEAELMHGPKYHIAGIFFFFWQGKPPAGNQMTSKNLTAHHPFFEVQDA